MKKVILLTVIMIFALASISWADRITYGGYVEKYPDGMVDADTLITVFNPNAFAVGSDLNPMTITVYDKYGVLVKTSKLLNGGAEITHIPPRGWGWQTIGNLIPVPQVLTATKYTFLVWWKKPTQLPYRGLVIEIKEIIYNTRTYPTEGPWLPALFKEWSETGLGATGVSAN